MACDGKPPYAWFARPNVIEQDNATFMLNGCSNRIQDCLTKCIYDIEVQVTCENGRAEPIKLRLTIGDDWDNTDVVNQPYLLPGLMKRD